MSPVSRRRKTKKTRTTKPSKAARFDIAEPVCTCPACSDGPPDVTAVIDGFAALTRDLALADDPLDAEIVGSMILGVPEHDRAAVEIGMVEVFIPLIAERETPAALALLLALGSVAESDVARAAHAAADSLVAAGIQPPRWTADLWKPVTSSSHRRLVLANHSTDLLVCEFHRGDRTLPVMVRVDTSAGGVATDISALAEPLEMVVAILTREILGDGGRVVTEELDAAEFRRQVEDALDARLDLDLENEFVDDTFDEDGGPGYGPMALFLRKRLEALPKSDKEETESDIEFDLPSLAEVMKLIAGSRGGMRPGRRAEPAKLPNKRKKSDGPAPVFQIKVDLIGANPPIWRRLEVPADITLYNLHHVIQVAFGWGDSHLHAFETEFGEFGRADAEFGRRADKPVTLEQVATGEKSTIVYTYDFGDDWRHEIVVEKVTEVTAPEDCRNYPRCTGGRRAAPPEDSGGMWRYENLIEILGDPAHPEHEDHLEWLGLDSPEEFDPTRFDAPAVNGVLARLR